MKPEEAIAYASGSKNERERIRTQVEKWLGEALAERDGSPTYQSAGWILCEARRNQLQMVLDLLGGDSDGS